MGGEDEIFFGGVIFGVVITRLRRWSGVFGAKIGDVAVAFEAEEMCQAAEFVADYALVGDGVFGVAPGGVGFGEGVTVASNTFDELLGVVFFADEEDGVFNYLEVEAEGFVHATGEAEEVS